MPMRDDATLFDLTARYPDEESAVRYFESLRWPDGVRCPECGSEAGHGRMAHNRRLWYCRAAACSAQFSVTTGTVMEDTKLPLRKWLLAFHLIGASKKGIPSLQLARMLDVTYKTAWHLSHRIRATMKDDSQRFTGIVETDETYIGGKRKNVGRGYRGNKIAVQTIVQRGKRCGQGRPPGKGRCGQAQTIALAPDEGVDGRTVSAKLRAHTDPENTVLMTDESPIYNKVGESFEEHHTVNHKRQEYVRHDEDGHVVTTNTAEGLFANLKRQITGTHHHTSKRHLPRYLEEYDYKYNTRDQSDGERTVAAIKNMEGKRLTLYKSKQRGVESLFTRPPPEQAEELEES